MDRGLHVARDALKHGSQDVKDRRSVEDTLRPSDEAPRQEREAQVVSLQEEWQASADPVYQHGAKRMGRFQPGVLVGGEAADVPEDQVD
jgi:hypothetical protein